MTELMWIITSSLMILAVIVIRKSLGRRLRPAMRYALWGLVLVRLLYPGTLWQSPMSIQSAASGSQIVRDMETVWDMDDIRLEEDGSVTGLPRQEAENVPPQSGEAIQAGSDSREPEKYVPVATDVTPEHFARMERTINFRQILETVWLAGIIVMAAMIVVTNLILYMKLRRRRTRVQVDCPVRVWAVEGLDSSCLFAGAIYVNGETVGNPERLRHVLAHELSHRRHLDPVWSVLRCAALAIHWYNPLVWYATVLSRQDGELCADAGAIRRLGLDTWDSYGETLIELSRKPESLSPLSAATTMGGTKRQLKERVIMIAKKPRATIAVALAAALIAAIAAGCAFAGKVEDNNPDVQGQENGVQEESSTPLPDASPTIKGNEILRQLLAETEPGDVTLSYSEDQGQGPVPGDACALAEGHLELLRSAYWNNAAETSAYGFGIQLETDQFTLTVYQSGTVHLVMPDGDFWLEVSPVSYGQGIRGFAVYSESAGWYFECVSAMEHRGNGTPLTAQELSQWNERFRGVYTLDGVGYPSSVNGFFLSDWPDPRDLDLGEFMYYFGWPEWMDYFQDDDLTDEELADVYKAVQERSGEEDTAWLDALPCHKIPTSVVNVVLEHYAGITLDDLRCDWRNEELYLEKYDSFYTFSSDFGPGSFSPLYGEREGDILTLWSVDHALRIQETSEGWKMLSHMPIA